MKKPLLYLVASAAMITACNDDDKLPEANFDLAQVVTFAATAGDEQAALAWTTAEGATPNEFYLSWTAGTAGVAGGDTTLEATATAVTIQNLVNDVTYTFAIQPRYDKGLAGKVTASCKPINAKFPVTNFKAAAGNELVKLTWTKPASDQLQGYSITVSPGGQPISVNTPATESYDVTSLTNGTPYTFTIVGVYPQGNSEAASVSATPGLIYPILVVSDTIVKNTSCTFEYNPLYFSAGEVQSVSWNFGDGSSASTAASPVHTYTTAGDYTVTITVTYAGGATDNGSIDMTVTDYLWSETELKFDDKSGNVKNSNIVFSHDGQTGYIPTTNGGGLFAVDVATGTIKWLFEIDNTGGNGGGGATVGTDGTIYFCALDKKVYAVNPNGTQKWATAEFIEQIRAFPALGDGVLYCLTKSALHALNTATGDEVWNQAINGGANGSAVAVGIDGAVYAGTANGVYAFESNGTTKWSSAALNVTEAGAMAFNGDGSVLYATLKAGAGLVAINIADGTANWTVAHSYSSNGDAYFPIVGADDVIYFAGRDAANSKVYAINPNGSTKWTQTIGAALIYAGLALSDNGVVYGGTQAKIGDNYKVFGLNTSDGTLVLDTESTKQIMAAVSIGPDKRLYIGTINSNNAILQVYNIDAGLEPNSWSVRGGNLQGTNRAK
ncbi:cell surface protein [Bacteroidia bacterium]|nr:cell surface protein [Bacteroidia bacterium]